MSLISLLAGMGLGYLAYPSGGWASAFVGAAVGYAIVFFPSAWLVKAKGWHLPDTRDGT